MAKVLGVKVNGVTHRLAEGNEEVEVVVLDGAIERQFTFNKDGVRELDIDMDGDEVEDNETSYEDINQVVASDYEIEDEEDDDIDDLDDDDDEDDDDLDDEYEDLDDDDDLDVEEEEEEGVIPGPEDTSV